MKTRSVVALVMIFGVGLVSGCSAAPVEVMADYPAYGSLGEVGQVSDVIVSGTVLKSRSENLYPDVSDSEDPLANPQAGIPSDELEDFPPVIITVSTVEVSEVFKGEVRIGDIIEVSQLGGSVDGKSVVERDTTLVDSLDDSIVLFLAAHPNAPYDLVNPEQGLLILDGDQLKPVAESVDIEVPNTVQDLRNLIDSE